MERGWMNETNTRDTHTLRWKLILGVAGLGLALGFPLRGFLLEAQALAAKPMTEVRLKGLRVRLGQPIQVTQTIGYAQFPTIAKFATGELIATYALTEDSRSPAM